MTEINQIRINELARELEIKAKVLLEYLPEIGVTEKKTHSSSLDLEHAQLVRKHFNDLAQAEADAEAQRAAKAAAAKAKPVPRAAPAASAAGVQPPSAPGARPDAPVAAGVPATTTPSRPGIAAVRAVAPVSTHAAPGAQASSAAATVPPGPKHGAASTSGGAAPSTARPVGGISAGAKPGVPALARPGSGTRLPPAPGATHVTSAGASAMTPTSGVAAPPQRMPSSQRPGAAPVGRPGAVRPAAPGGTQPSAMRTAPAGAQSRPGAPAGAPRPGATRPYPSRAGRPGAPQTQRYPQRSGAGVRPGTRPGQAVGPGAGLPKPEPGKPLYVRKPAPGRARPTMEKRFAEGERKLHPVRTRPGVAERRATQREQAVAAIVREPRMVTVNEGITVRELAEKLDIRAKELLKTLLDRGIFASINQALDVPTATSLAESFSGIVQVVSFEEKLVQEEVRGEEQQGKKVLRAPVVTVMGHVDHGKTSLLDAIRETDVAGSESGGITQHIGAYQVTANDHRIVFIDTPGHEAFTRMRARGARVTDIVVLVVGADDGVMPQTEEAIDHARAAKVPIIVAINKIDKSDAQPERVKRQLSERGLMPEDWGGDTVMVEVSARTKKNLDRLLEMILLVGELRELKANPEALASGTVLESRVDKGRGPVATVLVQNGTLRVGDAFICGAVYGKVRATFDDRGQPVREAGPSTPVEVLGLQAVPEVGDQFQVADEAKARHIGEYRQAKQREAALAKTASARLTLDQLHEQLKAGELKELPIVIKGDVQGSVEVLSEMLPKLSSDQVKLKIIHASVGAVSETDVLLASASGAVIVGFNVRPERKAADLAQQEGVDIRLHTIIYELVDELKKAMSGLLAPVLKETYLGRAEVRDTFRIKGVGAIAGCYIQDGMVKRDAEVRVLRDNVVIYTGRVNSLRRFKDDVMEVRAGFECGITVSNFSDVKIGDVLECFTLERIAPLQATA